MLLTAFGFASLEAGGNRLTPWSQITKLSKRKQSMGHPLAIITRRGAAPVHFTLATTADLAAFALAQDLWKHARNA